MTHPATMTPERLGSALARWRSAEHFLDGDAPADHALAAARKLRVAFMAAVADYPQHVPMPAALQEWWAELYRAIVEAV